MKKCLENEHWYDWALRQERFFNKILAVIFGLFLCAGFIISAIKGDVGLLFAIFAMTIFGAIPLFFFVLTGDDEDD